MVGIEFGDGRWKFDTTEWIGSISSDSVHRTWISRTWQQEMDQGLNLVRALKSVVDFDSWFSLFL